MRKNVRIGFAGSDEKSRGTLAQFIRMSYDRAMAGSGRLATVTPIRSSSRVRVAAPFRRFRRAGLLNARFGIEGLEPFFWGYHDPGCRWNGWATPRFCREVVGLIVRWINTEDPGRAWWEGDVLHLVGGDDAYIDELRPDELGLYRFDGWVWLEADEED